MSCNSVKEQKNESSNNTITEKYWKLTALYGKEIKIDDEQKREIFITLKTNGNSFTGFAGCNTIGGVYILEDGNKVTFSKIMSTRMFCSNNATESKFIKALNTADNYTLKDDVLSLNIDKKTPLAVFKAVYLQ